VKPSVSVHVETEVFYRPVCQNTAGMRLIKCTLKAFASRLFLPNVLPVWSDLCQQKPAIDVVFSEVPLFLRDMARNKGVIYDVFKKKDGNVTSPSMFD